MNGGQPLTSGPMAVQELRITRRQQRPESLCVHYSIEKDQAQRRSLTSSHPALARGNQADRVVEASYSIRMAEA